MLCVMEHSSNAWRCAMLATCMAFDLGTHACRNSACACKAVCTQALRTCAFMRFAGTAMAVAVQGQQSFQLHAAPVHLVHSLRGLPDACSQQMHHAMRPDSQNAKEKRESIGVELYGFQQNLAKLQLSLEQTHQNYQIINKMRTQVRLCPGAGKHGTCHIIHGPTHSPRTAWVSS